MKPIILLVGAATLAFGIAAGTLLSQQPPQQQQRPQPFSVGNRLGLPIAPAADGKFDAMSSNVKVYGAIYSAESCSYDSVRGVIVVPEPRRRAEPPDQQRLGLLHQSRGLRSYDGTIYGTQTGAGGQNPDPMTWQVWKITRDGAASIFVQGAPLAARGESLN
jgi:hypothetical protein